MPPKGNKKASNNLNGGPAKRQDKRNKNKDSGSDVSNSDNEQTNNKNNPSKCTHTLPENPMEEDYVADSAVDAGGSNTTPSQQNNTDNFSSPPPKDTTAPSAPDSIASGTDASMHAPNDKESSLLNASPNKDIMDTNDTSSLPLDTPTISILRRDYQAATTPNTSLNFRARMSGSGDLKRLVIHFNSTTEHLWAIQVTDIPFFIEKDDIIALFKKYGNIQSCRLHTRANTKVQQARIIYDDASSIQHFMDKQWAIYCYSTCLRITPCSLSLDQKKSWREFIAVLSQLPSNTKDVHLAPLVRSIGAMAVNIPLSLNSYKPK
ncbi:hypothetical protein RhiirA1_476861 [Rhizophagus irregularis]|uniref:RRM domain-containing protein n=1 Tax=Rhizophagus irregularis TaxID=588596 RepID=A0A2N0QQS6_9GLOM|nr:hypothetical protein RhiirA1_479367 [Rhizophagus irregularis]PKC54680.1 hypothetical protein RhiirA1_476861 [Rhizophagus irregularis]